MAWQGPALRPWLYFGARTLDKIPASADNVDKSMWIPIFLVLAQTYVVDANGRRVELPSGSETRDRKVIEQGPNGTVYEEVVKRRDASGNLLAPEKVRVAERVGPDGAKVVETTVYRGDLNGRFAPVERNVAESRQKEGAQVQTVVVERPNVNGGFDLVERSAAVTKAVDGKEVTNRSIYRPDSNGRMVEMVRQLAEKQQDELGRPKEVVTEYQSASTGKLEVSQQRVTVELKNPDGTTSSEITIYGMAAPGRPSDGALKLREQQLLTREAGPGNTVKESLSVRRPGVTDGDKLGNYQKVSEKIYKEEKKP